MTIRFVPARHRNPFASVVVRPSGNAGYWSAANDNGPVSSNDGATLAHALRHFASHRMNAAKVAADNARAAHASRDIEGFAHWLSVCRVLDRRLAAAVDESISRTA
jgi:hypothetical protein